MLMKAQTQKRPENRALDQGLRLGLRLFAVGVFVTITIVMATFAVLATILFMGFLHGVAQCLLLFFCENFSYPFVMLFTQCLQKIGAEVALLTSVELEHTEACY